MALDPTIALGYNPPQINFMQNAQAGLGMAQTAQNIQNLQAAQPGIVAQSQQQQVQAAQANRDFSIQQQIGANAKQFTNDDGTVNYPAVYSYLDSIGAGDKKQQVAKEYLTNTSTAVSNATNQVALAQAKQTAGQQFNTMLASRHQSLLQQGMSVGQADMEIQKSIAAVKNNNPGLMDYSQLPQPGTDLSKWSVAQLASTQTENEREQLAQNQTNLQIAQQGANTSYQSMLTSGRSQQEAAAAQEVTAQQEYGQHQLYSNASMLGQQLDSGGALTGKLSQFQAKYAGNAAYAPYISAVARYNQANGTTLSPADPGTWKVLSNESNVHLINGNAYHNVYLAGSQNPATSVPAGGPQPIRPTLPGQPPAVTPAPGPTGAQQQPGTIPSAQVPIGGITQIKNAADYNALPSGAHYITPDGKHKVKQ